MREPPVPVAARVVEVIGDLGPQAADRYRYGSGCLVGGRWVLTAAHVVAGAVSAVVRDPTKRSYTAVVDPAFVGDVKGPRPDLALVEISDSAFAPNLPPIEVARVDRDSPTGEPIERVHAIGYPWFAETPSPDALRDTVDAIGVLPVLSKLAGGLLSLEVRSAPRSLPPEDQQLTQSAWAGMSGAPILAAGRLLGVITEHAPRAGSSTLTAVPLTALQADAKHEKRGTGVADPAAWLARLGVGEVTSWTRLPPRPPDRPEPAYRATLREYGRTLHARMPQLLGRQQELADIAEFATSAASYRWLVGGAYAGKSALAYEAVTIGQPDHVDVVSYFLSRRASDASSERFLAAVVPQLAYALDRDPPPATVDAFRMLWEQAAKQAERDGRHLLLIVDGLDEDLHPRGFPSVASLLPALAGGHAHVHVTGRPRPQLPVDVPDGHPLRRVEPIELKPFGGAMGLAELARKEFYDLIHGPERALATGVLGLLTAAAGSLTVADLLILLADSAIGAEADVWDVEELLGDRAVRIVEPVGSGDETRWRFAHASLLEYAQDAGGEYAEETRRLRQPRYRRRIHDWAQSWREARWTPASSGDAVPRYLVDEYPATLTDDFDRLAELAGDSAWVAVAVQATGVDPGRRQSRQPGL